MDCRVVERMCARPVCCCILYTAPCILYTDTDTNTGHYTNTVYRWSCHFGHLNEVKTLQIFTCGAFASGGACGGPSNTPFSPPSGGFVNCKLILEPLCEYEYEPDGCGATACVPRAGAFTWAQCEATESGAEEAWGARVKLVYLSSLAAVFHAGQAICELRDSDYILFCILFWGVLCVVLCVCVCFLKVYHWRLGCEKPQQRRIRLWKTGAEPEPHVFRASESASCTRMQKKKW